MPTRLLLPMLAALLVASRPSAGLAQDTAEATSLGGYGEVHYSNHSGRATPGEATFKRFVIYLAHAFSDRISLRSELEIEDARLENGSALGEVALEQAYLDYRLGEASTLRAGLILAPLGILNETHEPPTFNGVARPDFDHDVLPTTWRELGAGVVGDLPGVTGVSFRLYLLNGLRADGFTAEEGIRGGRQEGQKASFANPSFTGRLEYGRPGFKLGAAFWYGGTADQDSVLGNGTFDAPLAVVAADGRYTVGALQFRGEFATIHVGEARAINRRYGLAVGSRITGGYLEGALDLLRPIARASNQKLMLFVRHERFDTHASVPTGTPRDPALARRITTFGVSYKPLWNVVFKGDYQLRRNRAAKAQDEVLALGVGYQF